MRAIRYQELLTELCLKGDMTKMDYVIAFLIGGAICAVIQIFMDFTKLMPGRLMVALVCIGALLSSVGLYKPFADWAGAGATVPLLGFGHLLFTGVKDAIDAKGFIGMYYGGLEHAAVGISATLIFAYLASLIFKPKMK